MLQVRLWTRRLHWVSGIGSGYLFETTFNEATSDLTPTLEEKPEVSKVIRKYNARIVEVNAVFAIVEKNGMSEEITNLYEELRQLDCVLQFVRSGRVAITTSCFERVNEYLADREAKYRQSKHQES